MDALSSVGTEFRPLAMCGDATAIGSARIRWAESGFTVRIVRGRKMRTLSGVFDEFAAAMQFPLYFGENENAFNECLADLDDLPPGRGYVIVIVEPDQLLEQESASIAWFASACDYASKAWAEPIARGEWWDRPAIPFHVVVAGTEAQLEVASQRWAMAGASLVPLVE